MLFKDIRSTNELPPLRDPCDGYNLLYDVSDKADISNKYFCSISTINDENIDLPDFPERCNIDLSEIVVTEQEVLDIISTLNVNKAVGPDIISNKMLISVKNVISKPLCMLFNKFLQERVFPTHWKLAHVIPLFKSGDKSLPSNYRPVSLHSCVSNILGKIIFKHIFNHLQKTVLLYKFQSEFIPKFSTIHQLI